MISWIVNRIANTPYARKAVEEKADLSAFKQKPTARILLGVFLIGFSYVIGWPAVSALAALAVYLQEPLVAIIGGPLDLRSFTSGFHGGDVSGRRQIFSHFHALGDADARGENDRETHLRPASGKTASMHLLKNSQKVIRLVIIWILTPQPTAAAVI